MAKIQINGTGYDVRDDRNLLHTCLSLGFDLPYFCYHPALGSVGACRQCAVRKFTNPEDKTGRIIMSCMEPVTEGLIISTGDPETEAFRAAVTEGLMTNHPHDCPVCDEGGECHLQDMTVMTKHNYRRFVFRKRTYRNQYLGPFIQHEMNRCIQCYRCVRFYRDYAGGKDLEVMGSSNRIYFGRHTDGPLESEFSGNLVEVCPTGVFTDKTLRAHYTRKWDLTNAPSVCTNCSLGCNIFLGERYGTVRRVMSRYNPDINGYFICDRGRFGYEHLNGPDRLKEILARPTRHDDLTALSGKDPWPVINRAIRGKKIAGIGSPGSSLEANFALEALVGKGNFFHGMTADQYDLVNVASGILQSTPAHIPSLKEIGQSDAVLVLGEDLINSAPMMALAVRQASRNRSFDLAAKSRIPRWNDSAVRELAQKEKSPVFIVSATETKLDDLAKIRFRAQAQDIARLGYTIASVIDSDLARPGNMDENLESIAREIADTLMEAQNPVIITGLQCPGRKILHAAANIALALTRKGKKPSLSVVFPECNNVGLALMDGNSIDSLAERVTREEPDTLVILENDLYTRTDKEKVDLILNRFRTVIYLGYQLNETAKKADIVIPSGSFAESTGTIVNNEGRAQRYYRVLPYNGSNKDNWRWLGEMIESAGNTKYRHWEQFDEVVAAVIGSYPCFSEIKDILPDSGFRLYHEKIARQTIRFSGRTAMNAQVSVSEPAPPKDTDSPLAFSMEGYRGIPPSSVLPYYWAPGWNSVQAVNTYLVEPDGPVKGDSQDVLLFSRKAGEMVDYFKDGKA